MRHAVRLLLTCSLLPSTALAQPLDETTSRPEHETPEHVLALERADPPPCSDQPQWARSTLDGGLASRRRPDDLPCRSIWDSPVRFELGLVGGGLTERGDGGYGGLSLSLGWRYHEMFRVYALSIVMFGGWDRNPGTSLELTSLNAFVFEVSPVHPLAVGFGPSFDLSGGCDIGVGQTSGTTCAYAPYYGMHSRVTLEVAEIPSGGLTVTGDVHVTLSEPEPRAMLLLGAGVRL